MKGTAKSEPPDRQLVRSFLADRAESCFRALYRRHSPMLYRVVLRLVDGSRCDADDVIQTTWIRALESLAAFRWESSLRSWLVGIALNCSREHQRQRLKMLLARLDEAEELPAPQAPATEASFDLEAAIDGLPDGYREVLLLHDLEGYTHGEIGELLGIREGTSKSQLARARRAVRDRITKSGNR